MKKYLLGFFFLSYLAIAAKDPLAPENSGHKYNLLSHSKVDRWLPAWGEYIDNHIPVELYAYTSKQLGGFCPKYDSMNQSDKRAFWKAYLRSWSYLSSDHDPNYIYKEGGKFNKDRIHQSGLFGLLEGEAKDPFNAEQSIDAAFGIIKKLINERGALFTPDYFELRPERTVAEESKKNKTILVRTYDTSSAGRRIPIPEASQKVLDYSNQKHKDLVKRLCPECAK